MRVNSGTKVANLNADRIDDREASSFANGVGGKATDADKLDGQNSSAFAPTSHDHDTRYFTETESDGRYLGKTEKAADADKLDGQEASDLQGPKAYAYINGWGYDSFGSSNPNNSVDESRSKNITDANVVRADVGTLCFNNLGFTPKNIQVQVAVGQGAFNKIAFADVRADWTYCGGQEQASVRLANASGPYLTLVDGGFYVELN